MQYLIASASLHDQLLLLKSHPSVLVFMLSSDELPPPDVEEMYHIPPASPPSNASTCNRRAQGTPT